MIMEGGGKNKDKGLRTQLSTPMCDANHKVYSILGCEQAKRWKKETKKIKKAEVNGEQGQRSTVAHSREV